MKYFIRFIGAFIVYPLMVLWVLIFGFFVLNILIVLWYFNFKHIWVPKKQDFYLYWVRDGLDSELENSSEHEIKIKWYTYSEFYKSPLDMLKGKLTRVNKKDQNAPLHNKALAAYY